MNLPVNEETPTSLANAKPDPSPPAKSLKQAVVIADGATRFAEENHDFQRNNIRVQDRVRAEGITLFYPGDVVSVGERLF